MKKTRKKSLEKWILQAFIAKIIADLIVWRVEKWQV